MMSGPFGSSQLFGVAADASHVIEGSALFDGSNYLTWTPTGAGSSTTKGTFAIWVKNCNPDYSGDRYMFSAGADNSNYTGVLFQSTNNRFSTFKWFGGSDHGDKTSTEVLRDVSAYYHLVVTWNTGASDANQRVQMWKNGSLITDLANNSTTAQDAAILIGSATKHSISAVPSAAQEMEGYIASIAYLDGQSINAGDISISDLVSIDANGVPIPIDISGLTFGTNGFLLEGGVDIVAGTDSSGRGNDFDVDSAPTLSNDSPTDSGDYGNYATMNPLDYTDGNYQFSDGNLKVYQSTASNSLQARSTLAVPPGAKIVAWSTMTTGANAYVGICDDAMLMNSNPITGQNVLYYSADGKKIIDGGAATSYGATYGNSDLIRIEVDLSVSPGTIEFFKDGVSQGVASSNLDETIHWYFVNRNKQDTHVWQFGAGGLPETPTSGFLALNSANFPAPTITKPSDQFLPIVYEGNGGGQRVGNFIPFTDAYTVDNSCMFIRADTDYLSRTPGSASNRKTWTFSAWVKRGELGHIDDGVLFCAGSGSAYTALGFNDTGDANEDEFYLEAQPAGGTSYGRETTFELSDSSSWFNYVVCLDTTESVANDRIKIWINGVAQTLEDKYSGAPTLNLDLNVNNNIEHRIGEYAQNSQYYDGYMAEVVLIDGTALTASSFGQTDTSTNRWIPKDVSGLTFGTNGFYLEFGSTSGSDSDLGDDTSGETNDWTASSGMNDDKAQQMYDTPTRNTCVFNTKFVYAAPTNIIGNLGLTAYAGANSGVACTDFVIPSSGKYYWEWKVTAMTNATYKFAVQGICNASNYSIANGTDIINLDSVFYYLDGASASAAYSRLSSAVTTWYSGPSEVVTDFAPTYQIAVDMDNGFIYFGRDNTWLNSGDPTSGSTGTGGIPINTNTSWMPFYFNDAVTIQSTVSNNWGQWRYYDSAALTLDSDADGYFRYTAPSEYKALNQDNMAENTAGITGFSWIKNRDATADSSVLVDRVRGVYDYIESDDTQAEVTDTNSVQRFLQQGVQVGNMDAVNASAESCVLWQWAANGTGTSDGEGSITSTVSANTTAGFSVIQWSGTGANATIGHGLGSQIPKFWAVKNTATTNGWMVGHASLANTSFLQFNNNDVVDTNGAAIWNSTYPAADIISLGSNAGSNGSGYTNNMICYAWAEVEGYSKFGSYTRNGVSDGPFIYLGFKPAWLMVKRTDVAADWEMRDFVRDPYNPVTHNLRANEPDPESPTADAIDFTSTGFKIRNAAASWNATSGTGNYVYIAFAENPFGGSGVAQAKAR